MCVHVCVSIYSKDGLRDDVHQRPFLTMVFLNLSCIALFHALSVSHGRVPFITTHRLLLEGGYEIDVVFTSRLKRAIRTVWIILSELNEVYLPVFKSWRLQERHYGALTGLSKKELAEQVGADLVQTWYVFALGGGDEIIHKSPCIVLR